MTSQAKYVLEWSKRLNALRVQKLVHALESNQLAFMNEYSTDFIIVFTGDEEVCHQYSRNWKPRVDHRAKRLA